MSTDTDPQAAYDAVVAALAGEMPVKAGKMFGMPCLKSQEGKAFAGYFRGAMVFKLTGEPHAEALGLEGARLFDPMENGRQMREWVEVPSTQAARWQGLARAALRYVGGI